jgi:hypothetical protein
MPTAARRPRRRAQPRALDERWGSGYRPHAMADEPDILLLVMLRLIEQRLEFVDVAY